MAYPQSIHSWYYRRGDEQALYDDMGATSGRERLFHLFRPGEQHLRHADYTGCDRVGLRAVAVRHDGCQSNGLEPHGKCWHDL